MRKTFEKIIKSLNDIEQKNSIYLLFVNKQFIKYNKKLENDNLCINIKLKENRIDNFLMILDGLKLNYKITNDNKYYKIIELNKNKNYIVIDYVVESHIVIPQSFLKSFGYKTQNGFFVDYMDTVTSEIKSEKTNKFGTKYGYYIKIIEDRISDEYESKIGLINKKLDLLYKGNLITLDVKEEKIIMDFFDITLYRNPKSLEDFNKYSVTSILVGGYDQNFLLDMIMSKKFPHTFKDLCINFIINKTTRNFIINESMISSIKVDNNNEVIILPINHKVCIALMTKEYMKKYLVDDTIHSMEVVDENIVGEMNKYIYINAKYQKEKIIGDKKELLKLKK